MKRNEKKRKEKERKEKKKEEKKKRKKRKEMKWKEKKKRNSNLPWIAIADTPVLSIIFTKDIVSSIFGRSLILQVIGFLIFWTSDVKILYYNWWN